IYSQGYETAKQFFNDVYQMYQDFFGDKNVHGGFVHFDEVHEYTDKDGSKRMSLPHMHALVSAYAEWTDRDKKTGETTSRKGINGKHFVTKGRMKELNKLVDDYCLEKFNVHFLTGETPQRKSVEQLKAEEEVHQLTGKKKQIQTTLDELQSKEKEVKQNLTTLTVKANETQQLIDEKDSQLSEIQKQTATAQAEFENLKNKIAEAQKEILSIKLPEPPTYPSKPSTPRPQQNREMYVKDIMGDYASTMKFFDRKKEEKRLGNEYDSLVNDWNEYDKAVKEYNTVDYPQWATATETVNTLQEQLRLVTAQQQDIQRGQRLICSKMELELKKQVTELEKHKEELQRQLDLIRDQIQSLAEQEYQRRRKHDVEVIAYYQQYCGITPDEIEDTVAEQEEQNLKFQDYNDD
ncbi:MAG: plasmid recombination protein, partial [Ruminococcus sp.]|nr:plasmid recombination protein [Ruminococcus sp.]